MPIGLQRQQQIPRRGQRRWSLSGQTLLLCGVLVFITTVVAVAFTAVSQYALAMPLGLVALLTLAIMLPLSAGIVYWFFQPLIHRLNALCDGAANFCENDFSTSIASGRNDEVGDVIRAFNHVGQILREERRNIFQRELLLDTVLQAAPLALVLTDTRQRVIYANPHARQLFLSGHKMEGFDFVGVLEDAPTTLREAILERRQGLISVEQEGETEIYHLSHQHFVLNARDHELHLLKPMTRELNRQEVATWKKVIRVISHELNNSLAPIASLANSGLQMSHQCLNDASFVPSKLPLIFTTIAERSRHLHGFIEGYARFARLPRPRARWVQWAEFLAQVNETQQFQLEGEVPEHPAYFDPAQLEQALINLIKNAHEAGSAAHEVRLHIQASEHGVRIHVKDRGTGISEVVMTNAMLPFYSTKKSGSGLGLALCREIMEAHDGRITITNRHGGGSRVSLWLPNPQRAESINTQKNTARKDSANTPSTAPNAAGSINE